VRGQAHQRQDAARAPGRRHRVRAAGPQPVRLALRPAQPGTGRHHAAACRAARPHRGGARRSDDEERDAMNEAFICDAVRTPIGRYGGALATMRTDDLASLPIRALMERNVAVDWSATDDVVY